MKRAIRLGILLLILVWIASGQATVDGFSIDQISYAAEHTGDIPCSEYGAAGFAVRQVPGLTQYVQIVAQMEGSTKAPAWLVRNVPAVASILSTTTPVNLTELGVARGTCITGTKISYTITVTDNTIATAPSYTGALAAFVGESTDRSQGFLVENPGPPGLSPPDETSLSSLAIRAGTMEVPAGQGDLNVTLIDRPGMANVIQNKNECGPAATTNSMHWLMSSGSIDLKGDTPEQSLAKLRSDMSWSVQKGVSATSIVAGKLRFAQAGGASARSGYSLCGG